MEGIITEQDKKYPDPVLAGQFQRVADRSREIIESANKKLTAISKDPSKNDSQRELMFAEVLQKAKKQLEDHLNPITKNYAKDLAASESEINQSMAIAADGLAAWEVRTLMNRMDESEQTAFIHKAIKANDHHVLGAIAGRPALVPKLLPELEQEAIEGFKNAKFPEQYSRANQIREGLNHFKKGFDAVYDDLDISAYQSKIDMAEESRKALSE